MDDPKLSIENLSPSEEVRMLVENDFLKNGLARIELLDAFLIELGIEDVELRNGITKPLHEFENYSKATLIAFLHSHPPHRVSTLLETQFGIDVSALGEHPHILIHNIIEQALGSFLSSMGSRVSVSNIKMVQNAYVSIMDFGSDGINQCPFEINRETREYVIRVGSRYPEFKTKTYYEGLANAARTTQTSNYELDKSPIALRLWERVVESRERQAKPKLEDGES